MIFSIGPLEIDTDKKIMTKAGQPLSVGPKVVATLSVLCQQSGSVVDSATLVAQTWSDQVVDESSLWQNIYALRTIFREHLGVSGIENVRGRGYRLVLPVQREQPQRRLKNTLSGVVWRGLFVGCLCTLLCVGALPVTGERVSRASAEGLRLYALGRFYWSRRTEAALQRARAIFQQEIAVDKQSAFGYSGLADSDQTLAIMWSPSKSSNLLFTEAAHAALRAVALEPMSAQAQTSYASTQEMLHHQFGIADTHYLIALSADPRYAPAHLRYGISLLVRRRLQSAVGQLRLAVQCEPASVITNMWLATALYLNHQPRDASVFAREAAYLGDDRFDVANTLGPIYAQEGNFNAARRTLSTLRACCPVLAMTLLAEFDAMSGARERALHELPTAQQADHAGAWVDVAFTQIYSNDWPGALQSLRRAGLHDPMDRALIALDPRMDPVRNDPRFSQFFRD